MAGPGDALTAGYVRFGGELPAGCDPLLPAPRPLPADLLAFSHGRAALSWLHAARGPFRSALVCAYTCPSVPRHLRGLGVAVHLFDVGAEDLGRRAAALPGPLLIVLPALLGAAPWLEPATLAGHGVVLVDAAQTAFAALEQAPPPGGAVLSCPRKTTALGDGALLRLADVTAAEAESVRHLADAAEVAALKLAARALLARRDAALEDAALRLIAAAEATWPAEPRRITDAALAALARLDRQAHAARRHANHARLAAALAGDTEILPLAGGVPFCLALLHDAPAELAARLRGRRVFATRLWPDADHDPAAHPEAHRLTRRLLALPVDQRYGAAEMDALAERVRSCL